MAKKKKVKKASKAEKANIIHQAINPLLAFGCIIAVGAMTASLLIQYVN